MNTSMTVASVCVCACVRVCACVCFVLRLIMKPVLAVLDSVQHQSCCTPPLSTRSDELLWRHAEPYYSIRQNVKLRPNDPDCCTKVNFLMPSSRSRTQCEFEMPPVRVQCD